MHGEYKIPGGKLVVVDLVVQEGIIAQLNISGDFFLAPDEALDWITNALIGLSVDTSQAELAERVEVATQNAELLGITPEGVAIAIERAVAGGAA